MPNDTARPTFFIIPHTHWEGAVFKTREEYLEMGLPNILRALALLEEQPDYRFTLDQTCYIRPFLERYPEAAEAFRRFVREGRLAIVGGTISMLDVNMPGGESFVRQVQLAKRYFREALGVDVTVGWQLDTFGHHAQMPQLLRQAGFESFWFFRGVPSWETPAEFLWEGLDGSRIPAFWLPQGYAVGYGAPAQMPEFVRWVEERFHSLDGQGREDLRAGPAGADVCQPEEHLSPMVEAYNTEPDAPLSLRIATPQEYEEALGATDGWPVLAGELNPVFQGIYSSRIELKQRTRAIENTLLTAEALGVVLDVVGHGTDDSMIERAWEPMLFNQAHDLMSGVMTDHVYADTLRGFDLAEGLATDELQSRLWAYGPAVDTRGEGMPIVVHNPLSWARRDLATVRLGFAAGGATGVEMRDAEGRTIPAQILASERRGDGSLLWADVAFIAEDVPALGHGVYHATGAETEPEALAADGPGTLGNEHYRVEYDGATGAITSLVLKATNWEALGAPGNVVVREMDAGDLWEPYRPLDGGSRIAMTEAHPPPPRGAAVYSDGSPGQAQHISGPVVTEFSVDHDLGEKGRFATRVRLCAGLERVEIRTRILNNDEFVRYRVAFPTTIEPGVRTDEIPFGAIQRPPEIEFPAQNWVDYGGGERGLALLNRGLPGHSIIDGTMLLSLCRSTRIVAYGFGGGYEPGMSSDTGLELGKELTFDYALLPHAGDWRDAEVFRRGLEFNRPLIAFTAEPHDGPLPSRWGLLEIDAPNVVVSSLKRAPDGSASLRVYEATGREARDAAVRLAVPASGVGAAGLLEERTAALAPEGNRVELELGPFEIRTTTMQLDTVA